MYFMFISNELFKVYCVFLQHEHIIFNVSTLTVAV